MQRYKTIVTAAAMDGRDITTLKHASRIARAAASEKVVIAHVTRESELPPELAAKIPGHEGPSPEKTVARLKEHLGEAVKLFAESTAVEYCARKGSIQMELARLATEVKADLVAFTRLAQDPQDPVGDLALKVLRGSPCSTLILPADSKPEYERVLVAVDFSRHSRETLDVAFALSSTAKHPLVTILHVVPLPEGQGGARKPAKGIAAAAKKYAEKQLEDIRESVNTRGIPWKTRFDVSADVPAAIVSVANEIDADLIVMSSHGRTQANMPILGHVTETVCSLTSRPLFCVKKPGEVVGLLKALLQFLSVKERD